MGWSPLTDRYGRKGWALQLFLSFTLLLLTLGAFQVIPKDLFSESLKYGFMMTAGFMGFNVFERFGDAAKLKAENKKKEPKDATTPPPS